MPLNQTANQANPCKLFKLYKDTPLRSKSYKFPFLAIEFSCYKEHLLSSPTKFWIIKTNIHLLFCIYASFEKIIHPTHTTITFQCPPSQFVINLWYTSFGCEMHCCHKWFRTWIKSFFSTISKQVNNEHMFGKLDQSPACHAHDAITSDHLN